jgi:hypothetical protein
MIVLGPMDCSGPMGSFPAGDQGEESPGPPEDDVVPTESLS